MFYIGQQLFFTKYEQMKKTLIISMLQKNICALIINSVHGKNITAVLLMAFIAHGCLSRDVNAMRRSDAPGCRKKLLRPAVLQGYIPAEITCVLFRFLCRIQSGVTQFLPPVESP
jgi:hypothetical protein